MNPFPEGPRANVEIKARYEDAERGARIAASLGATDHGARRQTDLYFKVPRGRLKLRRSDADGDELVLYLRPDRPGPKRADYEVIPVSPAGRTEELLRKILGLEVVVEKQRHLYLLGTTRIHLDDVKDLGRFLEFEAVYPHGDARAEEKAQQEVECLIKTFEIPQGDLVPHSYRELLLAKQ